MSDNYQIELIKRLKQQPRHGQGISPITQVENALKQLFDVYKIGGDEIVKLNIFGKIATQINAVVTDLTILQDLNQGLSEDFNKNSNAAAKLGVAFDKMSGDMNINMQKAKGYAGEIRGVIGSQSKLYEGQTKLGKDLIRQNDQLRNRIGLTDQANQNLVTYGLSSAQFYRKSFGAAAEGLADVAGHLEETQGYTGAFADIAGEFETMSSTIRVTFGRIPENLGLAIAKAKKLGTTVDSLVESGKGMLDVSENYSKEIEFQILSGKKLTTLNDENLMAEYQKAYLAKDANRMAELYAGFIQKYGEDLRDNVLLQETAGNIFGKTSDELFTAMENMAVMQQEMAATGEGSVTGFFKAAAGDINKSLYDLEKIVKAEDERAQAAIIADQNTSESIKTLGDYSNEVSEINDKLLVGSKAAMQGAGGLGTTAVNAMGGIAGAVGGALRVGSIVTDVITSAVTNPGQLFTRDESNPILQKNDVFIPSSAGTVVSGPFGSFALNAKDDILAMPGIGKAVGNVGGAGGESIGTAVAAALKGMSFHVTNVFDGKKIRSSLQILEQSTLNNTNVG
jgi:hypothetical protein